jgi:hypothetical protein
MNKDRKANLFVVGAMRSGTTFFADQLSGHSQIYVSPIKEPNFFTETLPKELYEPSRFFDLDIYFNKKFPEPRHIAHISKPHWYKKLFSNANMQHRYRAEASTSYLFAPGAAQRIKIYNPEATILIVLRDPIERAYSHYRMDLGLGRTKSSFEQCMKQQLELMEHGELPWYSYLNMSCYDAAVASYKETFENVWIIRFEDLIADTAGVLEFVSEKLNINSFQKTKTHITNPSLTPRYKRLWYWGKQWGLKDPFSRLFPLKFKRYVFQKLSKSSSASIEISTATHGKLKQIFAQKSTLYDNDD